MNRKNGSSSGGNRSHSRPTSSSRPLRENEVRGGGLLAFLMPNYSTDEDSYYDDDDYTYGSMSYTTFDDDTASAYSRRSRRHTRSDTMETLETLNNQLEELDSTINTGAVADAETVVDTIVSGDDDNGDYESDGSYENSCKMFIGGEDSSPFFSRMVNHLLPTIKDLPQQTKQKKDNSLPESEKSDTLAPVAPNTPETSTPETRSEVQERRPPSVDQDRANVVVEENTGNAMKNVEEKAVSAESAHVSVDEEKTPPKKNTVPPVPLPPKEAIPTPKTQPPTKGRFAKLRSPLASKKKALAAAAAAAAAEEAAREAEAERKRAERRERRRAQAAVRITVTHE